MASSLGAGDRASGSQESTPARCRINEDIDDLRKEFLIHLSGCVGQDLSAEQIHSLMKPEAQVNLVFRVDEALKKIARWHAD